MVFKQTKSGIALLTFLLLSIISSTAQTSIVHGKVTLYHEIAVKNATITIKKTKKSVLSDSLGFFSIECKIKDKISISAAGFDKKTVKVKNLKDSINVDLSIAGKESDIQLAADNGHIYQYQVDLATKKYNTKPLYSLGYPDTVALITGKFPQVQLVGNEFILRGINSINSITEDANNGALIVINGILSDVSTLNSIVVVSIKNIEILSGSAATKYGPGSGNGVILVELYSF